MKFDLLNMITFVTDGKGYFHFNSFLMKFVLICNPESAKKLLRDRESFDRPLIHTGLQGVIDDSLLLRNGEKWKLRRMLLNPMFRTGITDEIVKKMEMYSKECLERLEEKKFNKEIDTEPLVRYCAYQVIVDMIIGITNTAAYFEKFPEVEKAIHTNGGVFHKRILNIFAWSDLMYSHSSQGKEAREDLAIVRKFFRKSIYEEMDFRKDVSKLNSCNKIDQLTVISIFLNNLESNPDVSVDSLIDDIVLFISAGYHTTALTLCWILYELGHHMDAQKKVHEELDSIFKDDPNRDIRKEDLSKMNYLECVIKEGGRMYPEVPFTARRSNEEIKIGAETFPRNYNFVIDFYHLHRYPTAFSNPNEFDPDRFISNNDVDKNGYSVPFSAGVRNCIGYRFAMADMKIFLATLLRRFHFKSLTKVTPKMGELFLSKSGTFLCKITERST